MDVSTVLARMLDPAYFLTHLPYALLVVSMLMNDMGWLRAIAISAGLIRIVNRAFIDTDPIIVFWESIFVAVNVAQLLILWYYARRHRFSDDEKRFVDTMPKGIERRTLRRLLRLATLREIAPGTELTRAGQPVQEVIFIAEGVAQIERDGRIVAVCGPGDFVGEMSFVTGAPANATAVAARPMRYFGFDQKKLRAALDANSDMQKAMEASFNRNLVGKLSKANRGELPGHA